MSNLDYFDKVASRSRRKAVDTEESALVENMHVSTGSSDRGMGLSHRSNRSGGDEHYGSTYGGHSNPSSLHELKENGKKYKRRKRLEQVLVVVAAVLISTVIAVGAALLVLHLRNGTDSVPMMENYTGTEGMLTLNGETLTEDTSFLQLSQSSNGTGKQARFFPNLEYAVFGYNILNAYPLAFGHDPGFTHPIFLVKYNKKKRNADWSYHIPDGLDVVRDTACDTGFSSSVVQSQSQFDKSLSVSAGVSGGGFGVKFSASTQYKQDSSVFSSKKNMMVLTQAKCQQFFTQVNEFSPPPLHPSFIGWARKLHNTTDDRDFLDFVEYYGTHFLSEVAFGARFMYQFVMSTTSYKSLQDKSINVNAALSFSFIVHVDGKFSLTDSQKESISEFQQHVTTKTISQGTPPPLDLNATKWANQAFTNPVPISYSLLPVDQLFTDKFMAHLDVDYARIRHRLLHVMNVKYRKEVFDRSSNLHCRVLNHAVKLPKSACFQKSFNLMGMKSGPKCHGDCLETKDCLGIAYDGSSMDEEAANGCQTMYRMAFEEESGLLANPMNQTAFGLQQKPGCNTYIFPYRQSSNFGLKQPSWLTVKGVIVIKSTSLGTWVSAADVRSCKQQCAEHIECVAISYQAQGSDNRACGLFNKHDMDMVQLRSTELTTDQIAFIKHCS